MKKEVLKFKSKIDWLVALVYLTLIAAIVLLWTLPYSGSNWIKIFSTCALGVILIIFTWSVFSSYYLLTDDAIIAITGPFRIRVFYNKIKDVRLNRSAWSSFSLSFDRVLIICGNSIFNNYYFSPKNRELFIEKLKLKIEESKKENNLEINQQKTNN